MRHKLTLILAVVFSYHLVCSQSKVTPTMKGKWFIEGNVGNMKFGKKRTWPSSFESFFGSVSQNYLIEFYPRVGYYLNDNLVIGATVNVIYKALRSSSNYSNGAKNYEYASSVVNIGLIPYARYYFAGTRSKNRFYVQGGLGMSFDVFGKGKETSYNSNGEIFSNSQFKLKASVIYTEFLVGFNHFFTDNFAINIASGNNFYRRKETYNRTTSYMNHTYVAPESTHTINTTDFVFNLGFTIIIPGKKKDK